jgi:hypothetical protein
VSDESTPDEYPTLTCSRCDCRWNLAYELDELQVGNRAVEQFALDHHRHTGHYPDDITPWVADCRQCPETEPFLTERPANRFARTHARHTPRRRTAVTRQRVDRRDGRRPMTSSPA